MKTLRGLFYCLMVYVGFTFVIAPQASGTITFLNEFGGHGDGDGKIAPGVIGLPGVDVASNGDVYVVDPGFNASFLPATPSIQVFDREGNFKFQWGSHGSEPTKFIVPAGLAINSLDQVYVADQGNNVVKKFDLLGNPLKTFDGSETTGPGFEVPFGVAVGLNDQVYVNDTRDDPGLGGPITELVHRFTSDETYVGSWGGAPAGDDFDLLTDDQFIRLFTNAADPISGNVFTTDLVVDRVQVFDQSGNFIDKIVKDGSSDDGTLKGPTGVAVNALGDLYVADIFRADVQKFDSGIKFVEKFGSPGVGTGEFSGPGDLAVAPTGEIYVGDTDFFNFTKILRFFDSEAWVSGTNTFDDAATGPGGTALLGPDQRLTDLKTLVVNNTMTVNASSALSVEGGVLRAGTLDLTAGGVFTMTGGWLAVETVDGDLVIQGGTLAPGGSPGVTTVDGGYAQESGATIEIEVDAPGVTGGTDFDRVVVTGDVTLAGTLGVLAEVGFRPSLGTTFEVMTFASRTGSFEVATGTVIDSGLALAPLLSDTEVVFRASVPGDTNLDDAVTVADLSTFALNFGRTVGLFDESEMLSSWQVGDFNSDGVVTVADLSLLALNFGFGLEAGIDATGLPPELAAEFGFDLIGIPAVPEPMTLTILCFGIYPYMRRGHLKPRLPETVS